MRLSPWPCLVLIGSVGCGTGSESPFGASDGQGGGGSNRPSSRSEAPAAVPATPAEARGAGGRKAARRLAAASNAFGFDLFGHLREIEGNLALSPASLTMGLLLPWVGARGETETAFRAVLHLDGAPNELLAPWGQMVAALQDPARAGTLRIANRLYGEKSIAFEAAYLEAVSTGLGAGLEPVDFAGAPEDARASINAWVEEHTERRIRALLPPGAVNGETRLVLVNAVFFRGTWQIPFDASATRPATFHAPRGSHDVPTMHLEGSFGFVARDGLRALEMGYEGQALAMLLVLPDAEDGLSGVESALDGPGLDSLVAALAPTRVKVALPRFEIDPKSALPVGAALKSMGLEVAFDRSAADFTGIASAPEPAARLALEEVFHQAYVRVDEEGTEAAAATGARMGATSLPPPPEAEFRADRPFLFFIRDVGSGLVLFAGRVSDPVSPSTGPPENSPR